MLQLILTIGLLINTANAKAKYGLKVDADAPQVVTKDIDGKIFNLQASVKNQPVVLVFYRGGWCPYCNLQLRDLQSKVLPKISKTKMVAISVDKIDEGLKTKSKEKLGYIIISDPEAKILEKYNVKFQVPEKLVLKYKKDYKIDLEKSSGKKHHIIAVPAVFVIGKDGKIKYAYANEDYKVRAEHKDIINAVKKSM